MLPQILVLLAAVGGTAFLLGGGVWLWRRLERLESGEPGGAAGRPRLDGEVEELRRELEASREERRRLAERVDFLERLLEERDGPGSGERRPGSDGPDAAG
jgi:outer membrane murein-binding lipoprotein Lpp